MVDRQELDLDQVALHAMPLPVEFRQTQERRYIRVALALDPGERQVQDGTQHRGLAHGGIESFLPSIVRYSRRNYASVKSVR